MDVAKFAASFNATFMPPQGKFSDLCPNVRGMTSPKVQRLLQLGVSCLPDDECYFEAGTYQGKTLIAAAQGNDSRIIFSCDNFSEFAQDQRAATELLQRNLRLYCSEEQSRRIESNFHADDFRRVFGAGHVTYPIGFYFYDGAHKAASQRDAIVHAEEHLADAAVVVIDDWDFAPVRPATVAAVEESVHDWKLLYELPARFNGDRETWWNGVGILTFHRSQ